MRRDKVRGLAEIDAVADALETGGRRVADMVQAERQLLAVMGRGQIPATQRDSASAMLKQIGKARDEMKPMVGDTVDRAVADFQAGRYGQAKASLAGITRTGVELSSAQRSLVAQHQMRILEVEETQGKKFDDAPVSMGMLQPGTMRRDEPMSDRPEGETGQGALTFLRAGIA